MTIYIKNNQQYTEQQVRMSLPRLSLPANLLPEHVEEYGFTVYTPPPVPEPGPTIPEQVTRFQALAALYQAGQLPNVENVVRQAGGLAQLAWDNAITFERNSPTIAAIATALGWPPDYVDSLFIAAASIKA